MGGKIVRPGGLLMDDADGGEIPAVIANVGKFQREIRCKRMFEVQGPVPYVWSGDVAGHAHDGAGIRGAIKPGGADVAAKKRHATVPLRKDWRDPEIPPLVSGSRPVASLLSHRRCPNVWASRR